MAKTDPDTRHPMIQRLESYWEALCDGGKLPARRRIDPIDIPDLLPTLFLIDIEPGEERGNGDRDPDETSRFRYRLLGETITTKFMRNSTGKRLDQIYDSEFYDAAVARYWSIIRTGVPGYAVLNMPVAGREFIRYERLICPLATDGATIDGFVGVIAFPD